VEDLPESVQVRRNFLSSSLVVCGSSARILRIPIGNRLLSLSGVLESWLVGIILRHYLRVGDLPIIVSHSFVALCIYIMYSRIGVCLVIYMVPCLRINQVWDPVWRLLLDPSKVNHFDRAEDPGQHSQRGVGGIVYACGALGHMDWCGTRRSDSPVMAS
jgi:hypothetical protein